MTESTLLYISDLPSSTTTYFDKESSDTSGGALLGGFLQLLITVLTFVFNVVTFAVFTRKGLPLFSGVRCLFCNLALADTLFGVSVFLRILTSFYPISAGSICRAFLVFAVTSGGASASFVLVLCLQSYMSIKHPFLMRNLFTLRQVVVLSCVVWLVWLTLATSAVVHIQRPSGSTRCSLGETNESVMCVMVSVILLQALVFVFLQASSALHLRKMRQKFEVTFVVTQSSSLSNQVSSSTHVTTMPHQCSVS